MSKRQNETEESPRKKQQDTMQIDEGMGEFEDRLEDMDDETDVVITHNSDSSDQGIAQLTRDMDEEEDEVAEEKLEVYLPGGKLAADEELVVDQSTYEMLHKMNVEWPCLSFSILQDKLGSGRTSVQRTQADTPKDNKVYVMKMSSLSRTKFDADEDMSDDDDDDEDPVLEFKMIPHEGGAMPHPESHIIATMADTGKVHIFDVTQHVAAFDTPGLIPPKDPKPIHTISNHGNVEGYGIDWSSTQQGSLLTGDGRGRIFLTKKTQSNFVTESTAFTGHTSSIEDIQWSPSQGSVFASCSADKTVRIWDARTKNKPQLTVKAHTTDVNVISWNRTVDYLLASGSDSGAFSIWDLRTWPSSKNGKPETAASFHWHKQQITSIDWHPTESSVLAVAGADDQVTIWDLALERDAEEEAVMGTGPSGESVEVPAQLLFIHQGQKFVKEIQWHPQAPGVMISTAFDGFNVFKTFNS